MPGKKMNYQKKINLMKNIYHSVFYKSDFIKLYNLNHVNQLNARIKKDNKNWCLDNKKILIAGGTGRVIFSFLKNKLIKKIVFIDLVQSNVTRVKKYLKHNNINNVECYCSDLNKFNKKYINYFDLIYHEGVFQHLNNPNNTFSVLSSFMKKGGYFYLDFYRHGHIYFLICEIIRNKLKKNKSIFADFKKNKNKFNRKISFSSQNLYGQLLDDLFVPNIRFYNSLSLSKSLKNKHKIVHLDMFKQKNSMLKEHVVIYMIIKVDKKLKINFKNFSNLQLFKEKKEFEKKYFYKIKKLTKKILIKKIMEIYLDYDKYYKKNFSTKDYLEKIKLK